MVIEIARGSSYVVAVNEDQDILLTRIGSVLGIFAPFYIASGAPEREKLKRACLEIMPELWGRRVRSLELSQPRGITRQKPIGWRVRNAVLGGHLSSHRVVSASFISMSGVQKFIS